jgi:8-oxo-dGTP pyrophosphatase MutT (NUDIX family)
MPCSATGIHGYDRAMPTIEQIRARLQGEPERAPLPALRNAAVAVVLRPQPRTRVPDLLFIRRAERRGDPWSGHMAFPGGHADAGDADLVATACRETSEEVGLDLARHGELVGGFEGMEAAPGGRPIGVRVTPFVFELTSSPAALALSDEVAGVVWAPLDALVRGDNHVERFRHGRTGAGLYPGYALDDEHFVWGLTYKLLHTFFARIAPDWRAP